ncbi:hypothetical protein G7046_g862 [Stylonectria norvegica]|nr:hypothetical protein G7046_g862 [Stylonectria norvegica]
MLEMERGNLAPISRLLVGVCQTSQCPASAAAVRASCLVVVVISSGSCNLVWSGSGGRRQPDDAKPPRKETLSRVRREALESLKLYEHPVTGTRLTSSPAHEFTRSRSKTRGLGLRASSFVLCAPCSRFVLRASLLALQ